MATAQYEILIPQTGQDIGTHALSYVNQHYKSEEGHAPMGHLERGREVMMHGQMGVYDALVVTAEDTPYSDSFMKQLAHYIGDVSMTQVITVSKNGKAGINVWPIRV
jgi:hypothetical protein